MSLITIINKRTGKTEKVKKDLWDSLKKRGLTKGLAIVEEPEAKKEKEPQIVTEILKKDKEK